MVTYKLFRLKGGKLYPLFVECSRQMPTGVWLDAGIGELADENHVRSRLGPLALRPLYECSHNGRYMNPFFIRTVKKNALLSIYILKSSYKSIGILILYMLLSTLIIFILS